MDATHTYQNYCGVGYALGLVSWFLENCFSSRKNQTCIISFLISEFRASIHGSKNPILDLG